jgi:demethylmenaquinone methyltransferase/2-methoxy-6-polyprenyl-1,4-benzoquinol methylase
VVARLLRPGGTFTFVEISVPRAPVLRPLYLAYLRRVIPVVGRLFLGNPANYRLLGAYTAGFGDCRHFVDCLRSAGLDAEFHSYLFGCATGVTGHRPEYRRAGD